MFCLFLTFRGAEIAVDEARRARTEAILRAVPGLARAIVHTPSTTSDPYLNDGPPPPLVIEAYFERIAALEAACAGPLQPLAALLPGAVVAQQAMAVRFFDTPDMRIRAAEGAPHCTYLVAYEGPAEDWGLWMAHYVAHHPPIMAKFPGIRQIEIASPIDWCSALPFARESYMQRNKVVFDSPEALTAALNSPVRHEMRADFKEFPKFSGGNTHFPMLSREVSK